MGKPHCNSSICNFKNCTYGMSITSGSELCVCLFRVSASVFSVFFRVNPWQMLLLILTSVASSASACSSFRVNPWQMLLLLLIHNSVANQSYAFLPTLLFNELCVCFSCIFREIPCSSVANLSLLLVLPSVSQLLYFPC
jgi:hypothetical protein